MPIHRTSDTGIAVSIPLLTLRANSWIKVRVHQLVRIGLSSFRGERICLHSLQKEKVSRIAKKSAGTKKIHVYRCSRLREWRLAPMLIKTNPVKIGGKKQSKRPVTPRNLAAVRKERLFASFVRIPVVDNYSLCSFADLLCPVLESLTAFVCLSFLVLQLDDLALQLYRLTPRPCGSL